MWDLRRGIVLALKQKHRHSYCTADWVYVFTQVVRLADNEECAQGQNHEI